MNRIASFNGEGLRMKWLSPLPEWIPDPVSVDIIHPKCGISSFADIVETDLAGCIRLSHIDCTLLKIERLDRKSTRLNSSHVAISYAVFCLKKKKSSNMS